MSGSASTGALDVLLGEWAIEAGPPGGPPWPGGGRATFAWLDGIPLLVVRTHIDLPEAPDSVSVIGCDAANGTYYQLEPDDRDVQRIYEMSLRDGVWRLWRRGAPFAQRFTGTFSNDGMTIAGRWERSDDGKVWATDFDLTYTRVV